MKLSNRLCIGLFTTIFSLAGNALAVVTGDLVFTPISPCRIVDTRSSSALAIPAAGSRSFYALGQANYTSQGGSSTDCGTLSLTANVIAVNITAVSPVGGGYATAYAFGSTKPSTSNVNFAGGDIVNNAATLQVGSGNQFTIATTAQSNFVVDIVGYYAPKASAGLTCTTTFASQAVTANSIFDVAIPACAATYTLTGAGCRTPGFNDANWAINGLYRNGSTLAAYCSGTNLTSNTITVEGVANCCK